MSVGALLWINGIVLFFSIESLSLLKNLKLFSILESIMYIEELSGEPYVSFHHPQVDFDLRHFLRSSELLITLLDSLTQFERIHGDFRSDTELALVNMLSGSIVPFKPRPVVLPYGLCALQEEPLVEEIVADEVLFPEDTNWVTVSDCSVVSDALNDWQILV